MTTIFYVNFYVQVNDIREKNLDLMRPELITVLKHSQYCVVRELAGADPVAVFRWAILRAFCRAVQAFKTNRLVAQQRRGRLLHANFGLRLLNGRFC